MTRETLAMTREDSDSRPMTRDSTRDSALEKAMTRDSTRDSARVTRDSTRQSWLVHSSDSTSTFGTRKLSLSLSLSHTLSQWSRKTVYSFMSYRRSDIQLTELTKTRHIAILEHGTCLSALQHLLCIDIKTCTMYKKITNRMLGCGGWLV